MEWPDLALPAHLRRRNPLFIAFIMIFGVFVIFLLEAFILSNFNPEGVAVGWVTAQAPPKEIVGWKPPESKHVLKFGSNGRFQIAVFEDLHFGEGRKSPQN
jgi:hypothetical protein